MEKLVLGVTGGVGAGKSTVLKILKDEYGACVIEADAVGHRLEERGQPGFDAVVREFGDGILGTDGEIDRKKLAALVFSDADALQRLNGLLHPMIYEEIQEEIRREWEGSQVSQDISGGNISDDNLSEVNLHGGNISVERFREGKILKKKPGKPLKLFVLEAAILFETGFDRCCDATVYVRADKETRIGRLQTSRGYSLEKAEGIIANQLGDEAFLSRADHVIENSGDFEDTKHQVRDLMKSLISVRMEDQG